MKFLLLITTFLLFGHFYAQNNLMGRITDHESQPFSYCKLIIQKDSLVLATQFTDSSGYFTFSQINADSIKLILHTPFSKIDTILSLNSTSSFNLKMPDENELEEVTVSALKPTIIQKIDRVIFNPENIPILAGGNAVDVLKFAPGVYIRGNDILVSGGKSCQVLLNDKLIPLNGEELISFIYSIPTEDIQYVEIIDPIPLKYAASVRGGLINIKLRAGTKSRMSNGSVRGSIGQGIYTRGSLGFNYGYKKNKFSIYTNVSGSVSKYGYSTDKDILFPADSWSEKIRTRSQSQYYSAGIGINYELSKKTEIGFLFAGRSSLYRNRDNQAADYVNNSGALISTNNNNAATSNSGLLNSATFSLTHTFDTLMKQVSFLIDYSNQSRNDKTGFNNLFRSFINPDSSKSQQSLAGNTANFLSGGLDFTLPFKQMNITTGIRTSFTLNNNDLSVYNTLISPQVLEDSLSNRFKYTESIQAAYFTIGRDFKKWSFQLGARLEYTQTVGNQTTTHQRTPLNYVQVNPQFLVMYKQTDNSTWKFNYYRDFYRPSYNELNPFIVYQSYFSRSTGNPYLKPSINHSFELSHSFKNLRTALHYYYGKNGTSDVTLIDSTTLIQNRTTVNSEVSHYLGLNISYQIFDVKRWSLNTYLSASYNTIYSNNTSVKFNSLTNFSAFLFLTAAYSLDRKKTFFAELSASWITPWVQHFESKKMRPSYSIEIKKTLLNKRLSLSLNLNNLFNLNRMSSHVTINGVTTHTTDFYDAQSIYFNLSYSFGNRNIHVNEKRSGSTGESGRYK